MISALALAATLTATFRPAAPTVGDPIAVEFRGPVRLDPSPQYEIVSQAGNRAVVRTFAPRPIELSGVAGGVRFRRLVVPVRSVLQPNDKLEPAPLKPPRPLPPARLPFVLIAAAALAAAAAWAAAIALARRRTTAAVIVPPMPPYERYRRTVLALRENPNGPQRWAALADATRVYLAASAPSLGTELTTSQLLQRMGGAGEVVGAVLRQGDLEKFAPWGTPEGDFDEVAQRALEWAA